MWNPFRALYRLFKGTFNMQIYLVTIDSTRSPRSVNESYQDGSSNVRNFTLSQGIQNFYFIMAPNENSAKNMVLNTFRAKPKVQADVARCIAVTPLKAITNLLTQRQNTWSYIPIGGVRAPGQQGVNDTMHQLKKMNRIGENQEISHTQWQPKPPVTYDGQKVNADDLNSSDLGQMSAEERAIVEGTSKTPVMPQMPEGGAATPEALAAMMAQMQQMMSSMQQKPVVNENAPDSALGVTRVDPRFDPEMQARIQANASATPQVEDAPEFDTGIEDDQIVPDFNEELADGDIPEGWDGDFKNF